jgi:hypothetical protein
MLPFSIGVASFLGAVGVPLVYFFLRQLRHFGAWTSRAQRPKERVGVPIVLFVVLGFVVGSMAQQMVDIGASCHQRGKPLVSCVLLGQFDE